MRSFLSATLALLLVSVSSEVIAAPTIYWNDLQDHKIRRANLDGSGIVELVTTGVDHLRGIAIDGSDGKMYWTEVGGDTVGVQIDRSNIDGTSRETLLTTGLSQPMDIALDVEAGKMYWTDNALYSVRRANLNGSGIEVLVTGQTSAWGIALDTVAGKMYWANGSVYRANLDGTNVESIVTLPDSARSVAINHAQGVLYVAAGSDIWSTSLTGSSPTDLLTSGRPTDLDIDFIAGKLYWSSPAYGETDGNVVAAALRRSNLDGTDIETLVTSPQGGYSGIALDVPEPSSGAIILGLATIMLAHRKRSEHRANK
jgi:hypothetical protein